MRYSVLYHHSLSIYLSNLTATATASAAAKPLVLGFLTLPVVIPLVGYCFIFSTYWGTSHTIY